MKVLRLPSGHIFCLVLKAGMRQMPTSCQQSQPNMRWKIPATYCQWSYAQAVGSLDPTEKLLGAGKSCSSLSGCRGEVLNEVRATDLVGAP